MRPWISISILSSLALVPAATGEEISASHRAQARELLRAMELGEQFNSSLPLMIDVMARQNQGMTRYREVIDAWIRRYMTWEAVEPEMVELYAQTFSEPEMRELVAFYGTPVGKKTARAMPQLTEKGMVIGQRIGQAHAEDLRRMILEHDSAQAGASSVPAAVESAESDRTAQKNSLAAMRDVGTAMMSWLTDQVTAPDWKARPEEAAPAGANWSRCPSISYDALHALLSPLYMLEIPRQDGWGHALEFCLDPHAGGGSFGLGVRSPGRDGRFESVDFVEGKFDPALMDRDIVWLDGYFRAWPQP